MSQHLQTELKTYERHRDELLGKSEGKYVLVHSTEIAGVFDSKQDAIEQGYERFGNVPFLVKQILKVETPHNFVSNLLAV
jgi:hypothetical protein